MNDWEGMIYRKKYGVRHVSGSMEDRGFREFWTIFQKYSASAELDVEEIEDLTSLEVGKYEDIVMEPGNREGEAALDTLCVLKLNGGLGTTMGCSGPKSAIEVKDGMSFLDITMMQVQKVNREYKKMVPLVLMNSEDISEGALRQARSYGRFDDVPMMIFFQPRIPFVESHTLRTIPESTCDQYRYPPGHGSIFTSIMEQDTLGRLLRSGKKYAFISNADNLGATIDINILNYIIDNGIDFLVEVVRRTEADVKGGVALRYKNRPAIQEISRIRKLLARKSSKGLELKYFNTNNIWISLESLLRMAKGDMDLEILVTDRMLKEGTIEALQLEMTIGSAISNFQSPKILEVPRTRFVPVKSTSDLFLIQSDLYVFDPWWAPIQNPARKSRSLPVVSLGSKFAMIQDYLSRIGTLPSIVDLDHLTIHGDVTFGSKVVLEGTVTILARDSEQIDIPSGSTIKDAAIYGNLRITSNR